MSHNIHVGDVGTAFKVRIVDDDTGVEVDLRLATTKTIILKPPGMAAVNKVAEFITDGADGWIQYITVLDDLGIDGIWDVQGYVEGPDYKNRSEIKQCEVHANL